MRKLINIVKKPLLYGAIGVFAVFTILLVVISSLKHGKTYEYEMNVAGIKMTSTYTFVDDDTIAIEVSGFGMSEESEFEYKIEDGFLYQKYETLEEGVFQWEKMGEINAYEIVLETVDEETGFDMKLVMECKTNKAVRTLSIVMMVVSGLAVAGSVAVTILDKKGIIKLKSESKAEENAENSEGVETTETPVEVEETPAETVEVQEPKVEE